MESWLVLIIAGVLIYIFTMTPIFPAGWQRAGQALAGLLVLVGLLILVLWLFGVDVGPRRASAQEATPVPVVVVPSTGPSTWGVEDWIKLFGAIVLGLGSIAATVAIPIIRAINEGQNKQAAQAAISAEQQNRYLATRNAEPVTMQSPPMGTGDGRVDKAVANQLAAAPTSPSTVPAAGAVPPVEQQPMAGI